MLFNTGTEVQYSQNKLLSTLAWKAQNQTHYALEGSVFMAGAIVQWLRDGLGIIQKSSDVEKLACQVEHTDGVVLVPAFTGLGAPHWDSDARALLCGMSRGTNKSHIARAALEAIAFQVSDVLTAMQSDLSSPLKELRVDGGASSNDMLMQFQADILNVPVLRPKLLESTAWGAAAMAGLKAGVFSNLDEIAASWQLERLLNQK
jgi:Glycerol kinase